MLKKCFIMYLLLFFAFNIYSNEILNKIYYNNILSGGKEKIKIIKGDINKIDIYNAVIKINLYENYSKINAIYYIKNKQDDSEIEFAFPKLDAKLIKSVKNYNNGSRDIQKNNLDIKGDYNNFTLTENGNIINFEIINSDIQDTSIPFKLGNTTNTIYNSSKKTIEDIDSYTFHYSWYTAKIKFHKNEKKIIKVSYTSPLYSNIIESENKNKFEIKEDPALEYTVTKINNKESHLSEKIFNYLLFTPYSNDSLMIKKLTINLYTNSFAQEYLKITPLDYEKNRNSYSWKFYNLIPVSVNNILVKISPNYSENSICLSYFKITPDKIKVGINNYYKIDMTKDNITMEYLGDNINVKEIRIYPEYFDYKNQLSKINLPVEIQVEFDKNKDFTNPIIIKKSASTRKIIGGILKNSYISIHKNDGIDCKYIRIKILKTSKDYNVLNISNIQILE